MTLETWMAYVAAILVLFSTPGPSQLLMMSVSLSNGFTRATATAAGDLTANLLQMIAAGFGLGALVMASETAFLAIKWSGVAYLVWMGWQKIAKAGHGAAETLPPEPLRALWLKGFLTSAANPKAVVFFAALFPQFISPEALLVPQIAVLTATYLVIDGMFLAVYGASAGWMGARLVGPARIWLDRASGAALIAAAVLLGLRGVGRDG